jgi:hypothetical protein
MLCTTAADVCSSVFDAARQYGFYLTYLPVCGADETGYNSELRNVPSEITGQRWPAYHSPQGYSTQTQLAYPEAMATYHAQGSSVDVQCFSGNGTVSLPTTECSLGRHHNPEYEKYKSVDVSDTDCSTIEFSSKCLRTCLDYVLYSEEDIRIMWMCYVIPGLVGFAAACYLAFCTYIGRKTVHKAKTSYNIKLIAWLSILYHLLNTIPVVFLFTDMVCENETVLNKGQTTACFISKGTIHLIQMCFYLVAAQLVSVCSRSLWGMGSLKADKLDKAATRLSLSIPSLAALVTYLTPHPTCDDGNFQIIKWRLTFSCFPFLPEPWMEWMVTWIHILIGSAIICVLVIMILVHMGKLMHSQVTSTGKFSSVTKFNPFNKIRKGTEKLVMIGCTAAIMLVTNLVINLWAVDAYNSWHEKQENAYFLCNDDPVATTIEGVREECKEFSTEKLPLSTLCLGFFSIGFTSLAFCAVFAWDKKNFEVTNQWLAGTLFGRATGLSTRKSSNRSNKVGSSPGSPGSSNFSSNGGRMSGRSQGSQMVSVNSSVNTSEMGAE